MYGTQVQLYTDHKNLQYLLSKKELSAREARWVELIDQYDLVMNYHPGKANVVADALSRKKEVSLQYIQTEFLPMMFTLRGICAALTTGPDGTLAAQVRAKPMLLDEIHEKQKQDPQCICWKQMVEGGMDIGFHINHEGMLYKGTRVCVPNDEQVRGKVLKDGHDSMFAIHPGTTKMYQDLKRTFWWPGMKSDVVNFVSKCDICKKVKADHKKPGGVLNPLEIPEWKWEKVNMDFVTGFPRSSKGNDAIWVIIDRLTKTAVFIPIKVGDKVDKLARLYVDHVIKRFGTPITITSDRDPRFTSKLWQSVQEQFGTQLNLSTAFHPQTDGQSERVIQVLEDMLRCAVLEFGGSWEEKLSLIEFTYNNSYQASLGTAPFEVLYGRRCRSPIAWEEVGDRKLLTSEMVEQTTRDVKVIKERLVAAQDRQKKWADRRRTPLEFAVGDNVYLKIAPWKGVIRFGKGGKLAPRYVGPYRILERIGQMAYRLKLPEELSGIHDVFHVSMLRKSLVTPAQSVATVPIQVKGNLTTETRPEKIMGSGTKVLRGKQIPLVRVLWRNDCISEETWEREDEIKKKYPFLF